MASLFFKLKVMSLSEDPSDIASPAPLTADAGYRARKETWVTAGCLPENDLLDNIDRLAKDFADGKVDDIERKRIKGNADILYGAGQLSDFIHTLILKALGYEIS